MRINIITQITTEQDWNQTLYYWNSIYPQCHVCDIDSWILFTIQNLGRSVWITLWESQYIGTITENYRKSMYLPITTKLFITKNVPIIFLFFSSFFDHVTNSQCLYEQDNVLLCLTNVYLKSIQCKLYVMLKCYKIKKKNLKNTYYSGYNIVASKRSPNAQCRCLLTSLYDRVAGFEHAMFVQNSNSLGSWTFLDRTSRGKRAFDHRRNFRWRSIDRVRYNSQIPFDTGSSGIIRFRQKLLNNVHYNSAESISKPNNCYSSALSVSIRW